MGINQSLIVNAEIQDCDHLEMLEGSQTIPIQLQLSISVMSTRKCALLYIILQLL